MGLALSSTKGKKKQTTWLWFFFSPLPLKAIRALSGDVLRSGLKVSVLKGIDEVNYLFYDEQTRPAHSRAVCRKLCSFPCCILAMPLKGRVHTAVTPTAITQVCLGVTVVYPCSSTQLF